MKTLIIAGYFPPYSPASASRVNKLAKYMEDQGHDVRVLCPTNDEFEAVLTPEVSQERIHYTAFSKINDFPTRVKGFLKSLVGKSRDNSPETEGTTAAPDADAPAGTESKISILYRQLTNIPDNLVGWYPHAIREGKKMFQDWSPDIIFATLPPFTTMMVANRLGRMIDVPVIYDYRDLWTDHPYYDTTGLRRTIDLFLENRALKSCAGLVTVTKTWADHLKSARNVPVEFVMNGFDPADFNLKDQSSYDKDKITLLYAGYLYGEKRDPSVVFEALGKMGSKAAQEFTVLLYTPEGGADLNDRQNDLIKQHGLEDVVVCNRYIPQKELLTLQQQVDVLMLLRWDHPSENGVIAGKLFEYIGANKPILSLGSTTGEAADIIRDNDFGLVSNDVDEVAAYLSGLLKTKKQAIGAQKPNPNRENFTRARQFTKLVTFMEKIIADHKGH
ncbi:MAG: glycosyltransferase family 4 protein [Alphaproteobacteria bacterium]|nr:glycosyltransferase family 4 protein [Alphaproteobacteria bacterium]